MHAVMFVAAIVGLVAAFVLPLQVHRIRPCHRTEGDVTMEHLIRGVRDAVENPSWYAATALALMLPDAYAAVEEPGRGGAKQRYIRWAERWTQTFFTAPTGKVFLSAAELYRLRCAFLHEGDFVTSSEAPQAADDSTAMFEVLNQVTLYDDGKIGVVPTRNMMKSGSDRTTGRLSRRRRAMRIDLR